MNFLRTPDMVTWEITERCNMHCKHCSNAVNGKPFELNTHECKKIIDRISDAKVFKVGIEGGEPLVRSDLIDLIDYMNQKRIQPSIATNGLLLNTSFIESITPYHVDSLQISLDGPDRNSYALLRGNSSYFDQVIHNIKVAVDHRLPITIAMVVSKSTYLEIPRMAEFAQSLGVKKLRFIDYVPSGRGQLSDCLSPEELKTAYSMMCDINIPELQIITPNKLMALVSGKRPEALLGLINPEACFGCEAGTVIAHIRANGDLFPCSFFREKQFSAGNILENSLQTVWKNAEAFSPFRATKELPTRCKSCDLSSHCFGGCRAYAYYFSGSLQNKDPRCWG